MNHNNLPITPEEVAISQEHATVELREPMPDKGTHKHRLLHAISQHSEEAIGLALSALLAGKFGD